MSIIEIDEEIRKIPFSTVEDAFDPLYEIQKESIEQIIRDNFDRMIEYGD